MHAGKNASYIFWHPEKMPPEMNFLVQCTPVPCGYMEKMPPKKKIFPKNIIETLKNFW